MKGQCVDLLAALKRGPLTTGEIRGKLGIGMPATRVYELKQEGHEIVTERVTVKTRRGVSRVARYRLVKEASQRRGAA